MNETCTCLYTLTDDLHNKVLVGNIFYWRGADVTRDQIISDILDDHPGFSQEDVHVYDTNWLDMGHKDIAVKYNLAHRRIEVGLCKKNYRNHKDNSGDSWKKKTIKQIESLYGGAYSEFKGHDDTNRRLYVHKIDVIMRSLESMQDEPETYIKGAMEEQIKRDKDVLDKLMNEIRKKEERAKRGGGRLGLES